MRRWSRLVGGVLGAAALALAGCATPSTPGTAAPSGPADPGLGGNEGNRTGWSPQEVASSLAEAVSAAASEATGDRGAVIDAAVEAGVDQAMLVDPDLGLNRGLPAVLRAEVTPLVTDAPGGGVAVDAAAIRTKVEARLLEWFRTH
jgi:hypothetical protein